MVTVPLGWIGLIGVALGVIFYTWNKVSPSQDGKRVKIHCYISLVSFFSTLGHLFSTSLDGWSIEWVIWSGFGPFMIVIASGIILLYLPDTRGLRYHARSVHPALVVVVAIILLNHVLVVLGVWVN
ncbi:hypothetical protein ACFL0D_00935 [Thermoproteota archaeon]